MATISARMRSNGSTGYTARIRIKRGGAIVHQEAETFSLRSDAVKWAKRREAELDKPGALERIKQADPPLADVIERYVSESEKAIGRTKSQVLRAIKAADIGALPCSKVTSEELVAFARGLDVEPSTAANYLSHLQAVFAVARPAWRYPLEEQAMRDALGATRRLGITGKSKARERRPTLAELDRLMEFFTSRNQRRPGSAPMPLIIAYAIFSTRRQEEITLITWDDFDPKHARQKVRDMKNPGEKAGNDVWCTLTPEAIRLTAAAPRTDAQIFPYSTVAISAAFTRACKLLGIEDLRFHDLRHEGVSRLFEMGWQIPRVAEVSGHRSWASLQRYTQFREVGDKFAGWRWLEILAPPSRETHDG